MSASPAERRWREVCGQGALTELPTSGQPLPWEDATLIPPEWRIAFQLLKNTGLAPVWICLDREIGNAVDQAQGELQAVRGCEPIGGRAWLSACERFSTQVSGINERIAHLNPIVPNDMFQRCPLQPDRVIAALVSGSCEKTVLGGREPQVQPAGT